MDLMKYDKKFLIQKAFDLGCLLTIAGIWPRFIEPQLLDKKELNCSISRLPAALNPFRIVQFSDIHFNSAVSNHFLEKLKQAILESKPDMIVFTGDFLCYSQMEDKERFKRFFCSFNAPYGCFAILGNHDYEKPVAVNPENGIYDVIHRSSGNVLAGLKLLLKPVRPSGIVSTNAKNLGFQPELIETLAATPFQLLHNESRKIPVGDSFLNIVGLGEYTLGKCSPEEAFAEYDTRYPGIVLSHNPDSLPMLQNYPGDMILCGHTHGAQINLPAVRSRLTMMEYPEYRRGRHNIAGKMAYINRGVGSVFPFRWRSPPEITRITLKEKPC